MNRSKVHRLVKLDADENVVKIIKQNKIILYCPFCKSCNMKRI